MASALPEPPSVMSAAKSVGVRDGMEALAFAGTETPPNWAGEEERAFSSGQRAFKSSVKNPGTDVLRAGASSFSGVLTNIANDDNRADSHTRNRADSRSRNSVVDSHSNRAVDSRSSHGDSNSPRFQQACGSL